MKDFFVWISLLFSRWQNWASGGGLGGAIVVIVYILERLSSKTINKKWYLLIFVFFFILFASFMVWKEEYRSHMKTKEELKSLRDVNTVKLDGRILSIGMILSENKKDMGAIVMAEMWNSGVDSAVKGYWAKVSFGDKVFDVHPIVISDEGFTISDMKGKRLRTYFPSDQLFEKTLIPIKKGEVRNGVLVFEICGGGKYMDINPKWTLYFKDYLDKTYEIHLDVKERSQEFRLLPGTLGKKPIKK